MAVEADGGTGDRAVVATAEINGVAHSPQNRAVGRFGAPQAGQPAASGAAQVSQNLRPASFSVPQFEQITRAAPARR